MTDLGGLTWVETPCPLCGEEEWERVTRVDRYAVPLRIVRCPTCGHVYLSPRPSDADLVRLYDEDYYTATGEGGGYSYADDREVPEAAALRAEARLARIEELVPPGRILEVGCSFGAFLLAAKRRAWRPKGLDLSPYAVKACRESGLDVREGTLDSAPFAPGTFDLVYLSETMEHLPRPRDAVRTAFRLLAPGGLLVLATGNHASLARLLRGRRWGYYMPGHLQYFTARSLAELLSDEGLPVARVRFGDDRSLFSLHRIRKVEGRPSGVLGMIADAVKRIHFGSFSLGAGMVLAGRKPEEEA